MSVIELSIFADPEALAEAAADRVATAIGAMAHDGPFRLALAGGSTPKRLYAKLADDKRIDWSKVALFWGDERVVAPDHESSNYRMACEALVNHVPIPSAQVHRMEVERGASEAAADYFSLVDQRPLDLVLLGMGGDGHVASIFPGFTDVSGVAVTRSPVAPIDRVSLALDVINRATEVWLLVAGASKAKRLAEVEQQLNGGEATLPAAMVRPARLSWLVDEAAARELAQERKG